MEDYEKYTPEKLEQCTYRYLQQTAKGMGLPSNVKKIHLINLICAKKFKTPEEVDNIVYQVRLERQRLAQVRKNRRGPKQKRIRLQGTEISSTSTSHSPPITITPKSHMAIRYSPQDHSTFIRYKPKTSLENRNKNLNLKTMPLAKKPTASDRVLRSFNMKSTKYGVLNMNKAVFGVIKAPNRVSEETTINIVGLDGRCQKLNVTAVVRKRQNTDLIERQLVHASTSMDYSVPAKRKRTLSGIYPLKEVSNPNQYVSSLVRKTDGRLGKINTYIQRPKFEEIRNDVTIQDIIDCNVTQTLTNDYTIDNSLNCANSMDKRTHENTQCAKATQNSYWIEKNAQALESIHKRYLTENSAQCAKSMHSKLAKPMQNRYIIENNIQPRPINSDYLYANNLECVRTEDNRYYSTQYTKPETRYLIENNMQYCKGNMYYNDSINVTNSQYYRNSRADQGKASSDWILPKINAVFSKFGDVHHRELTKPIYVQVSEEADRFQNYPLYIAKNNQYNTTMLESLYNFKTQFVINQPLLKISTSAETKCVFSTPIITTPKVQPTATVVSGDYYNLCERANQHYSTDILDEPRVYDFFRLTEPESPVGREFHADEVLSSSSSLENGIESSQELGANVTIPEMVEDALEIISQDGDYMERIGMDVRMQCILCSWAGPHIILDYHLRKEHSSQISLSVDDSWVARYSLGTLGGALGDPRLVEHEELLYCLQAKYTRPDRCTIAIAMLSSDIDTPKRGKLTTYNKATGEPYTWEGTIPPLSPTMSFEDQDCLNLEISRLNLLPTSANLKLYNRELVRNSPSNVVIGQPELDDIHIIVHVNWFSF